MTHPIVTPAIIGLDLGDRSTHLCALDAERQVLERGRFSTSPERLLETFARFGACRVVLEAGSQSPWITLLLRELGFDVQVANPRSVALISKGHRKTDRRDAEVLARLALGMPELIGEVHHRTRDQQAAIARLRSRDLLVRLRTMSVQHARGLCKAMGVRLPSCSADAFHRRMRKEIPEALQPALEPVLDSLEALAVQISRLDRELVRLAKERYPAVDHLQQVCGVGPVTSIAFVLTIADPTRFPSSRVVGSWVGLAPRSRASGDCDPELSISKTGDSYLRRLLVQCAQYILGPFGKDSDLRRFGQRLAARGGKVAKRKAVTAVARKLATLLHRLWVTGDVYEPLRNTDRARASA